MNSLFDPLNEVKDQNIYNYEISQPKPAEFFDIESSTRKEARTAAGGNRFKGIGATCPPNIPPQTSHQKRNGPMKPLSLENTEKFDSKHFKITFNDPNAKLMTNTNQSS
jgi:hypothetical protein